MRSIMESEKTLSSVGLTNETNLCLTSWFLHAVTIDFPSFTGSRGGFLNVANNKLKQRPESCICRATAQTFLFSYNLIWVISS